MECERYNGWRRPTSWEMLQYQIRTLACVHPWYTECLLLLEYPGADERKKERKENNTLVLIRRMNVHSCVWRYESNECTLYRLLMKWILRSFKDLSLWIRLISLVSWIDPVNIALLYVPTTSTIVRPQLPSLNKTPYPSIHLIETMASLIRSTIKCDP